MAARSSGGKRRARTATKGIDPERFQQLDPARRRGPLVWLVGEEPLFRREAYEAVLEAVPGAVRHDFDRVGLPGGTPVGQVLDRLRARSLFGGEPVVRLRGADAFVEQAAESLERWLAGRPRGALVLELAKLPPARKKVMKALREQALIVDCSRPYGEPPPWKPHAPPWDTPLHDWLRRRARRRGFELDGSLAHAIVEATGRDCSEIAHTIEKLSLLVGPRGACTAEHIEAVVGHTRRDGVFALVQALADRNAAEAFAAIERGYEVGLSTGSGVVTGDGIAVMTVTLLSRLFDEVRKVQRWLDGGGRADTREIASRLGMSPMAATRALRLARALSPEALRRGYRLLLACDRGTKGRLGGRRALEVFAARWCLGAGARPAPAASRRR